MNLRADPVRGEDTEQPAAQGEHLVLKKPEKIKVLIKTI